MKFSPPTFRVNGAALRAMRMRQGLGVRETAEAVGLSRSYIQRLETGIRQRMRPATYAALRDFFNATDEQLLVQQEDPSAES
ncbi:helix-turn-helix transcriptional regulator [Streptomyces sp. NPDC003077]|uniref:helix-turn-helix domain-containing protein n=1 Tax=Streptomyces sp. NPDC003077 TaxID=3154443 RepID=UPI0033A46E9F